MDNRTNRKIKDFVLSVMQKRDDLTGVYLFGSYAGEKDNGESDIDLAFVMSDMSNKERFDLQVELMVLAVNFDIRIEPHPIGLTDFNGTNPFAAEIMRKGIEIKDSEPENWFSNYSTPDILNDGNDVEYVKGNNKPFSDNEIK